MDSVTPERYRQLKDQAEWLSNQRAVLKNNYEMTAENLDRARQTLAQMGHTVESATAAIVELNAEAAAHLDAVEAALQEASQ